MRELNVEEQQGVAGGMTASNELIGWVPSSVLLAIRAGAVTIGRGGVGLPIRVPGLIPGPVLLPSPIYSGGPGGLPYDC